VIAAWPIALVWLAVVVLVCLTILFMAHPHGVRGAVIAAAIILGLWFGIVLLLRLAATRYDIGYGAIFFVFGEMFALPLIIGSALGVLFAWGLWGSWPDDSP